MACSCRLDGKKFRMQTSPASTHGTGAGWRTLKKWQLRSGQFTVMSSRCDREAGFGLSAVSSIPCRYRTLIGTALVWLMVPNLNIRLSLNASGQFPMWVWVPVSSLLRRGNKTTYTRVRTGGGNTGEETNGASKFQLQRANTFRNVRADA